MVLTGPPMPEIPNQDILSWMFDEQDYYSPDKAIFIDALDTSRSISSRQARSIVRRLAAGLKANGLQRGDCVCVHSFNDIYYPMLVLGIIAAGGVFVGTNPSYGPAEMAHTFSVAKTRFLIAEPHIAENALVAAAQVGIPPSHIFNFDVREAITPKTACHQSWRTLLEHGETDWLRFNDARASAELVVALLFSSGTTGLPKAAQITNRNLISQHELATQPALASKTYPNLRRLVCLPMFHAAMVPGVHFSALKAGTATYILRRFTPGSYLAALEQHRITDAWLVPPMVLAIVQLAASSAPSDDSVRRQLRFVKHLQAGAAPMSAALQNAMQELLPSPNTSFTQLWAMSETTCVCTQLLWPVRDETGSVGRSIAGLELKFVDVDSGVEISEHETSRERAGEIYVRGPTVFKGYKDNDTANAEAFTRDGWFRTGDIAFVNKETGYLHIADRGKELIKVRGFQVAPAEVEAVLLQCGRVGDAAVIGVRLGGIDGEVPRAYVVRKDEGLTEEEVKEWVEARLAKFKKLDGGVEFVDGIPKNPTGKILRRFLREKWAARQKAEGAKL